MTTRPRPDGTDRGRYRVAVIGGGIAGLAAATALAERGVAVELYEKEAYLGGRVGAWNDELADGTPTVMGRGFHAFFRQYYNLRGLLRRADPGLTRLTPVADYPLIDRAGRVDSFRGLPRRPPWNAIAFALRSPTFTVGDLLRLSPRAALPLATVSVPATYAQLDRVAAGDFLASINFPEAARHLAFEVFSRSFFAPPSQLSAAELAVMFHIYFLGSSEGLLFDVPDASFGQALWDPLAGYLGKLEVRIHAATPVQRVEKYAGRYRVYPAHGPETELDAVVIATDLNGLRHLVESSPDLGGPEWRDQVAIQQTAPPFVVRRLWLDRPVNADRSAFLGTGGWGRLDNISVLDRYEFEAAQWAARCGGSVVELHGYAIPDHEPRAAVEADLDRQLHAIYPELAAAGVIDERTIWRADCPLFAPGSFAQRLPVATPDPAVVLAGDGIRIDLPVALMERAASTGLHAANLLLARFGLVGHELYTVPNRRGLLRHRKETHEAAQVP